MKTNAIKHVSMVMLCLLAVCSNAQTISNLKYEKVELPGVVPITIELAYVPGVVKQYSAIMMIGNLKPDGKNIKLPDWSTALVKEGFMLAAFEAHRPPDPDTARRPQWLYFDQRFAHSYVLGGLHAPTDAGRVIDYLQQRKLAHKFGWLGSSSTGIPGLSVATREPRLNAIVAFVATGAYKQWLYSWHTNGLWNGKTPDLWPETDSLLNIVDPILHVNTMFPCAVLMVSGGADKVVDARTARAFTQAARPYYADWPERLRMVVYDEFSHNLPVDVITMYAQNWFRLYLHPVNPPPPTVGGAKNLNEAVKRTSVTGADHKKVVEGN